MFYVLGHAYTNHVGFISVDPASLGIILVAALLYLRAINIVGKRNRMPPWWQIASFYAGILCLCVATQTIIDGLSNTFLSVHMAQHLLLADIAGPLLMIGVRAPVIYFFWPKKLMIVVARQSLIRSFWRYLRKPPVALTIWLTILTVWHLPGPYQAAVRSDWIHYLEHATFALGGLLVWWPLLDPTHERVKGRAWKIGYVAAARTIGGGIGIWLAVAKKPVYGYYEMTATHFNVDALVDQQIAGAMMMGMDFVIVMAAFVYFMARMLDAQSSDSGEG